MKISITTASYFLFSFGFLSQVVYTAYYSTSETKKILELNKSPYVEKKANNYKIALHLHSDEVFYTPERHTVKDIIDSYSKFNYDLISISDYNQITQINEENKLISYEWGRSFRKRHVLIVGVNEILPSNFFIHAFLENIQLVINEAALRGGFISISHPDLYGAFSKEDLNYLQNYHAIEVFTPFGDKTETWDFLLTHKGQVYCMSSDDLHYFPESIIQELNQPLWKDFLQYVMFQRDRESEAFLRYIVVRANDKRASEIKNSLLQGDYFCIKKFNRNTHDLEIPEITILKDKIQVKYKKPFLRLHFISNNGRIVNEVQNSSVAEYPFDPKDQYVRIEVLSLEGILLSNPIYLK
ncbi:MAG: phosphoesterase [Leptospiraceae bacterium]|nr:phosphoesterase [Leptospiraceae bacterium]